MLDGTDVDLLPGDGIQQYPADVRECDPGFEATSGSKPDIVAAILALPPGSAAVVANHSETLYSIITETTGVDTSDSGALPEGGRQRHARAQLQRSLGCQAACTRPGHADSPLRFRAHAAK